MGYIKEMRKKVGHDRLLIAGTAVFIHHGGRLLLQKRADNGCWGAHGGCIEIGENTEDGARRELFEETGITANKLELIGVFSGPEMLYTYPNGDEICVVAISYACDDFEGKPRIDEGEVSALKWFSFDDLPENINPLDKPQLEAFLNYIKTKK